MLACGLDLLEGLEHAAVELDVIGVAEIGHDVVPEAGSKHERVGPLSTGQSVVAIAADQAVTAISTKQEIITAAAVEISPLWLPAMMPLPLPPTRPAASTIDWPSWVTRLSI